MATAPLPVEQNPTTGGSTVTNNITVGSTAVNIDYPISDQQLNLISNSVKSSIMSASRYGSSTLSSISSSLNYVDTLSDISNYALTSDFINGLLDNTNSSNYQVTNVGTSRLVRISILLWDFQPLAAQPKVTISNGTISYSILIPTGLSKKNIQFEFIPSSFVANFYVRNETGASFSSYGNSIKVQGL